MMALGRARKRFIVAGEHGVVAACGRGHETVEPQAVVVGSSGADHTGDGFVAVGSGGLDAAVRV